MLAPMPWEKQFDRSVALKRALRVFWKGGYQKSSMSALLRGMGIQKGSFYATFKSKHHVLMEALQLYIEERFLSFQSIASQHPPLDALRRHLDEVLRESIGRDRALGCFLVNCATELAPGDRMVRDVIERTLEAHAKFYQALLDNAKASGRLPATFDAGAHAKALLGLVLGMRVLARGGAPESLIRAVRRQADQLLDGSR